MPSVSSVYYSVHKKQVQNTRSSASGGDGGGCIPGEGWRGGGRVGVVSTSAAAAAGL